MLLTAEQLSRQQARSTCRPYQVPHPSIQSQNQRDPKASPRRKRKTVRTTYTVAKRSRKDKTTLRFAYSNLPRLEQASLLRPHYKCRRLIISLLPLKVRKSGPRVCKGLWQTRRFSIRHKSHRWPKELRKLSHPRASVSKALAGRQRIGNWAKTEMAVSLAPIQTRSSQVQRKMTQ